MVVWMVQGEYVGIRCSGAKGRYLQARKQGHQRLVFFSDHCGVWEQWKVGHVSQQTTYCNGRARAHSRTTAHSYSVTL